MWRNGFAEMVVVCLRGKVKQASGKVGGKKGSQRFDWGSIISLWLDWGQKVDWKGSQDGRGFIGCVCLFVYLFSKTQGPHM